MLRFQTPVFSTAPLGTFSADVHILLLLFLSLLSYNFVDVQTKRVLDGKSCAIEAPCILQNDAGTTQCVVGVVVVDRALSAFVMHYDPSERKFFYATIAQLLWLDLPDQVAVACRRIRIAMDASHRVLQSVLTHAIGGQSCIELLKKLHVPLCGAREHLERSQQAAEVMLGDDTSQLEALSVASVKASPNCPDQSEQQRGQSCAKDKADGPLEKATTAIWALRAIQRSF